MQIRTALLIAACAAAGPALAQDGPGVEVALTTADGASAGRVTLQEARDGVILHARLENLSEGAHGVHIHETGACAPDFGAAGGHYAPAGTEHGYLTPGGFHAGDLPNIHVQADGTAEAEFFASWLTLTDSPKADAPYPLDDGDGSAIMVHGQADDYEATPSGSTGDRVACGVIAPDET